MRNGTNVADNNPVRTVLVVDDDPEVRHLLSIFLQTSGCQVLSTGDCEEALEFCEKYRDRLDILVTDMEMPKMRGFDLALEAARILPKLPVLFVSSYVFNEVEAAVAKRCGWRILPKPIEWTALFEAVASLINAGRGVSSAGPEIPVDCFETRYRNTVKRR